MILSQKLSLSLSAIMCIINAPIVIFGYIKLGKKFLIKVVYSMLAFSLFTQLLESIKPLTDTPILATIVGGAILGLGVGSIIREGGCVDGTEVIGTILSKSKDISITQFVMGFNLILYTIAGLLFTWDRALYSIISYYITFKMIDAVSIGIDSAKACKIITSDASEIVSEIYKRLGRTATITQGVGLATQNAVDIVYVVISRLEIAELKQIAQEVDASSFITVMNVEEVIGTHVKKVSPKVVKEITVKE